LNSVKVDNLPYYTTVSNKKIFPACFYHIKAQENDFAPGSKIHIYLSKANNVDVNVFGGNSLTNASIPLNDGGSNKTFVAGRLITVDASTEAVILV
jgi:hypothetical protein